MILIDLFEKSGKRQTPLAYNPDVTVNRVFTAVSDLSALTTGMCNYTVISQRSL